MGIRSRRFPRRRSGVSRKIGLQGLPGGTAARAHRRKRWLMCLVVTPSLANDNQKRHAGEAHRNPSPRIASDAGCSAGPVEWCSIMQQFKVLQSLWAVERRHPGEAGWALDPKLAVIRDAGRG